MVNRDNRELSNSLFLVLLFCILRLLFYFQKKWTERELEVEPKMHPLWTAPPAASAWEDSIDWRDETKSFQSAKSLSLFPAEVISAEITGRFIKAEAVKRSRSVGFMSHWCCCCWTCFSCTTRLQWASRRSEGTFHHNSTITLRFC